MEINYTFNSHAHLQTLTKTPAQFQEYPARIVGGVAFTRYPMTICYGRSQAKILLCSNCEKDNKLLSDDNSQTFNTS